MASSIEEVFKVFKPFIKKGMVGIVPNLNEEKDGKVIYNKMLPLDKVLTAEEIWRLQPSENQIEARKSGCKTDDEIIEYCNAIFNVKKEKSIKTGKVVICDELGLYSCKDSNEDCSLDRVYEVVTPSGDIQYIREHCY